MLLSSLICHASTQLNSTKKGTFCYCLLTLDLFFFFLWKQWNTEEDILRYIRASKL